MYKVCTYRIFLPSLPLPCFRSDRHCTLAHGLLQEPYEVHHPFKAGAVPLDVDDEGGGYECT